MRTISLSLLALVLVAGPALGQTLLPADAPGVTWINEFHYDDLEVFGDLNEFVEIAIPTVFTQDPTEMALLSLVLYHGGSGKPYDATNPILFTPAMATIPFTSLQSTDLGTGYSLLCTNGLSTLADARGGFALVRNGTVFQFLSYESAFTAAPASIGGGPAAGMTSTLITDGTDPVAEHATTLTDASIYLTGTGDNYADYTWTQTSLTETQSPCAANPGQVITFSTLPVELTTFGATTDGRDVVLRWQTATETENAGFNVEIKRDDVRTRHVASQQVPESTSADGPWESIGFVDGHGTTREAQAYTYRIADLDPGTHRFRLKQVDFDGSFAYSAEVEATVNLPEAYLLSQAYPNPFNPSTAFKLSVAQAQPVRVEVYNALGRRVDVLFNGLLPANSTHTFRFEAGPLPSGLYFYRATGTTFADTRAVMLQK